MSASVLGPRVATVLISALVGAVLAVSVAVAVLRIGAHVLGLDFEFGPLTVDEPEAER